MKIIIATAQENYRDYASNDSLIQAFRDLGHEVLSCGPYIGNYDGEFKGKRDIRFYDKHEHPETYSYSEVLEKSPWKPDLILQIDPHFYLIGPKPKDIVSAYYIVDVHRGASVFREMALKGNFNFVFLAHKYFAPLFETVGLKCYWLPRAYSDTYIHEYSEIEPLADISFCGETGINDKLLHFDKFDAEVGLKYHDEPILETDPSKKYRSWENRTMEYTERAEILICLSQDFKIRIYEKGYGPKYAKALCRGKIVVNHSLWFDSALRNFEVLACNRFLITDMLPFQDELLSDVLHYKSFNHYFMPFLDNFKLEYQEIKELVQYYLEHEDDRDEMIIRGNKFVKKYHTFKHRAQTIIDTIEGKCEGYARPY